MITDDTFKVGPESASFDGLECKEVEEVLRIAEYYSRKRGEIISDFFEKVKVAREDALSKIEELQEEVKEQMK